MKHRIIFQILIDAMFPNEIDESTLIFYIDFINRHITDKDSQISCMLACRDIFKDELVKRWKRD